MPENKPQFPLLHRLGIQAWTKPLRRDITFTDPVVDAAEVEEMLQKYFAINLNTGQELVTIPLPCEKHLPRGGDSKHSECVKCGTQLVAEWRPK
jgi:hypothetical protein